jgi:hypothetical protein
MQERVHSFWFLSPEFLCEMIFLDRFFKVALNPLRKKKTLNQTKPVFRASQGGGLGSAGCGLWIKWD